MAPKNNRPSLEELFELPEDYLRGPQTEVLRPGLIEGVDRKTKQDRLLKFWPKTGTSADEELRDLWRHERLQVDRIMSYPGADEVFAGVVAMIETSDTFCIVHEPGSMPLEGKLRTAPKRFWMRNLSVPANRVILWQNLARLAKALGILHSHGLLHGRICPSSGNLRPIRRFEKRGSGSSGVCLPSPPLRQIEGLHEERISGSS